MSSGIDGTANHESGKTMKKSKPLIAITKASEQMSALDAAGWGLIVLRADRDADIRRVVACYPHKRCETEYKTKGMQYYDVADPQCDNIKEAIGGGLLKNFFSRLSYLPKTPTPNPLRENSAPQTPPPNPLREWLEKSLTLEVGSRHRLLYLPNIGEVIGPPDVTGNESGNRTPEQMQNLNLIRAFCEEKRKGGNHSLIVVGSRSGKLCSELSEYAYIIDIGCPEEKEIVEIIWETCEECGGKYHGLEAENANELAAVSRGMRADEIRSIVRLAFARYEHPLANNAKELFNAALDAKKQRIAGVQGLRWIDNASAAKIGGMTEARAWLTTRSASFNYTFAAQRYKVAPPKGVLLAGLPGCGKTLFAKFASRLLGGDAKTNRIPVLQMDLSAMLGKYVGQAETNFSHAVRMIENVAPCIVIVDEIEKFFGDVSEGGHETSRHILASFLEWMQDEHGKPILVIATANNVKKLPPELKRKGRFDETFFVGIPNCEECKNIMRIHLENKREVLAESFGYDDVIETFLAAATQKLRFFNGADLEAVINSAFCSLFAEKMKDRKTLEQTQSKGEITFRYSADEVKDALRTELEKTRSYFDNNMDETASYWLEMRHLNFRNAGGADLYQGIDFNEEDGKFSFGGDSHPVGNDNEYRKFLEDELEKIEDSPACSAYDDAFRYKLAISIFKRVQDAIQKRRNE